MNPTIEDIDDANNAYYMWKKCGTRVFSGYDNYQADFYYNFYKHPTQDMKMEEVERNDKRSNFYKIFCPDWDYHLGFAFHSYKHDGELRYKGKRRRMDYYHPKLDREMANHLKWHEHHMIKLNGPSYAD